MKNSNKKDKCENIILEYISSLFERNNNYNNITILSNISSVIYQNMKNINWVGFYLFSDDKLILGPFQGKPACMEITLDRGVCGYAARNKTSIIVDDVHMFEGHIACDPNSNSELVIPILFDDKLYGLLDIDSEKVGRFTDLDLKQMKEVVEFIKNIIKL